MVLGIRTKYFCLFATIFVFTQCAAQRHDLKFGMQFSNFEDQSHIIWDFSGLDTCCILDVNLVFSEQFDWYLEGETFPLPENVKSSIVSIDLINYWDGASQEVTRIDISGRDSLSCLGRIRLCDRFDTYLIRHASENQWTKVVRIYMVNVRNKKPLSIVGIGQYAIGSEFRLRIYTILNGKNEFVQESMSQASDIIDLNKKNGKGQKFIIDDYGKVKVL